jgi:hypothetical protein
MNGMAWHPSFPSDGNGQLRNPRPLVLVIGAAGSPRHPWWVPWSRWFACDPMQLFLLKKCISSNSQTPTLTSNPLLQLSLITAVLTSYRISTLSPIALNTLCDSLRLGNRFTPHLPRATHTVHISLRRHNLHFSCRKTTSTTVAMSNAPTLFNLPPPPSDPVTPSDIP